MTIEKRQSPYRSLHPVYFKDSNRFIKALQRKKIYDNLSKFGSLRQGSTTQYLAYRSEIENTTYSLKNKSGASKLADSDLERNKSSQTLQKARQRSQRIRFKNRGKWIESQMKIINAIEAIERRYNHGNNSCTR